MYFQRMYNREYCSAFSSPASEQESSWAEAIRRQCDCKTHCHHQTVASGDNSRCLNKIMQLFVSYFFWVVLYTVAATLKTMLTLSKLSCLPLWHFSISPAFSLHSKSSLHSLAAFVIHRTSYASSHNMATHTQAYIDIM